MPRSSAAVFWSTFPKPARASPCANTEAQNRPGSAACGDLELSLSGWGGAPRATLIGHPLGVGGAGGSRLEPFILQS